MIKQVIVLFLFVMSVVAFGQDGAPVDVSWIDSIIQSVPWLGYVLSGIGALVVLAQVVVLMTPTKKDDEFMQKTIVSKLVEILSAFAPIKKK